MSIMDCVKKLVDTKEKREERGKGVLMEDLDKKLDQVLEGYNALDAKIDKNHGEFREFVSEVNFKFDIVFKELRGIHGEMNVLQDGMSALQGEMRVLQGRPA